MEGTAVSFGEIVNLSNLRNGGSGFNSPTSNLALGKIKKQSNHEQPNSMLLPPPHCRYRHVKKSHAVSREGGEPEVSSG